MMNRFSLAAMCVFAVISLGLYAQDLKQLSLDLDSDIAAVRAHAVRKLAFVGAQEATPLLARALSDPSPGVRVQAAQSLAAIKASKAIPELLKALSDEDVSVRKAVVHALGEIKDPASMKALMKALGDSEFVVRDEAAWALREIGGKGLAAKMVTLLRQPDADVGHLEWLLTHADGSEAVPALIALMDDPATATRIRAVKVLAKMKTQESAVALVAALDDASPEVRVLVANALGERGDESSELPLRRRLKIETDGKVKVALALAVRRYSKEDKLTAHWSFDDQNASVAKDVTGRGIDGEIKGCVPVEGKVGHALEFGPEKYVELGKPSGLKIGRCSFTVMAWAKTKGANGVVVARGGAFCGYSLYVMEGKAKFGIHCVQDGPAYIATGSEIPKGEWFHIAGVVKQKSVEVYINGKRVGEADSAGYIPGECGQGMEIGFDTANSPCEIVDPFVGTIDEVKVYAAALNEKDLTAIYSAEK